MSAPSSSPVTPDDLRATADANAELGHEYQEALSASLMERFDAQVQHGVSQRATAITQDVVTIVIALGSIGLGVVFVAASDGLGKSGATIATIVAWVGIAVINVAHARSRRR